MSGIDIDCYSGYRGEKAGENAQCGDFLMNVSLTPELEYFVTRKVDSGLYGSQSEVVREGLRLLMERDRMMEARLQNLRTEIAEGLEQARRGELIPGEDVRERIRRKSRERRK
jgi:antitoxin ParD1/3/4